jgi:GH15 family glucan-1,4-alpha-glucosidase
LKLALIGNCAYQALVDDHARIVWLCWPRFDSSFVFGALLDEERGGQFSVEPAESSFSIKQEYLENTNVLRTVFDTEHGSFEVIDFAPRFKQYERSFKPTMLMRRIRRLTGSPRVRVVCNPVYDYAKVTPNSYLASNHIEWSIPSARLRLTTNVPLTYVSESRPFVLENDAFLCLTWGAPLEAPLQETWFNFYERTVAYWQRWVKHTQLPGRFQREVVRSALALKLHQYEDTGAITAASTTSLPEEHGAGRNWDYRYCWLRDSYFTLRAMHRIGHFDEMEGFVQFLKNVAEVSPEQLQPVYAISGEAELHEEELPHLKGYLGNQPVRAGNAAHFQVQNDVYGEMLGAIAPLFTDIRFGHDDPGGSRLVTRLLDRVESTLVTPDAGIWEYRGAARVHTFSLLMHWFGARVAEHIGRSLGDATLSERAAALSLRARDLIEGQCYRPDLGRYGDSTTTENPDASLLMMVNLGYLGANDPRAESHVRSIAAELTAREHLMHRYRHQDDFGQSKSTFTVCGFWYAEALARLGYKDEAEDVCRSILEHVNHVGLFSEDLDPDTGEQLGNFPQTYSHVGLINAAFAICPVPEDVDL